MSDMVKVPGVGPVKKAYAVAGVGVVFGILAVMYWRRSKTPAASPADSAVSGTDTSAAAGAIDPSTGLPYGAADAGTGTGYGQPNYGGYSGYYPPYNPYNPYPSSSTYTTNSDWASAAEAALVDAGITLAASTTAISRVLAGLSVTTTQRDIFLQGKGLLGVDPPNGYPKPIKLTDNGTGGGGATLPAPSGLHSTGHSDHTATFAWNKVTGAIGYRVYRSDVGYNVGESSGPSITIGGLVPNHTYTFHVRTLGADGKISAASSANVRVHTNKK